jgi:hypothetical protein
LLLIIYIGTAVAQGQVPEPASENKPAVVVYVDGDMPANEKSVFGKYLLTSLINSGICVSAEYADAFLTAIGEEWAKRNGAIDDSRICEIGRQFGIRYICNVNITPAFGFYTIAAHIVSTETMRVRFSGETASPLKTMEDLTKASNSLVENMFGKRIFGVQTKPESAPSDSVNQQKRRTWWYSGVEYTENETGNIVPVNHVSKARNDYYDHPHPAPESSYTHPGQDAVLTPKYAFGIRRDINQTEAYLRLIGEYMSGYFGLVYFSWDELTACKLSGFLELRADDGKFCVYGGPGFALGYYSRYNYRYDNSNYDYGYDNSKYQSSNSNGMGIFIGAQIGIELRWGAFAVGANLRFGYAYNNVTGKPSTTP